jgi:hypothetical protein
MSNLIRFDPPTYGEWHTFQGAHIPVNIVALDAKKQYAYVVDNDGKMHRAPIDQVAFMKLQPGIFTPDRD